MESGFAALSSALYWNFAPRTLINPRTPKKGDVVLTPWPSVSLNLPGYPCPDCKLALIHYSNEAVRASGQVIV